MPSLNHDQHHIHQSFLVAFVTFDGIERGSIVSCLLTPIQSLLLIFHPLYLPNILEAPNKRGYELCLHADTRSCDLN